jgi:hypothetical protein
MRVATLALSAMLLAGAACDQEEGPLMAPGQDCIGCHDGGEAKRWTAAGTWTRGARVSVTDANGKNVPMRGNDVGNFYTAESLTPPLTVSVDGVEMVTTSLESGGKVMYGGCNLCHQSGGASVVDPELMAPGRDCLRCHDGRVAKRFYAGGTFPPAGLEVVITDGATPPKIVRRTTNAVGNFWIEDGDPDAVGGLVLPLRSATVDGEEMPRDEGLAPNCGACHGAGGEADDD